jgi:glycosyltransferase involved in cell wall biosynthesis
MNVLFMTIAYPKAGEHNIYTDLMKEFVSNHHNVYIACTNEKRNKQETHLSNEEGLNVLRIRSGNLTGNINLIEKGISTITIESKFIKAINTYLRNIKFDLILYSTPPITFAQAVKYFKKRDKAKTYLLLKDIFPQNAIDINLIRRNSLIHLYFREKEKKLYALSDYIGCMSEANVNFVVKNNPEFEKQKVEVCPNSIIPSQHIVKNRENIKNLYHIPEKAITFIYGGNLGKPQGIDFVIDCLKKNINREDRFFIICGNGTEYQKLEEYYNRTQPQNVKLFKMLPKNEYEELLSCCDVGLIFLDYRFTIPNFPSRLLSYMEYSIPVLACTDINTDIGKVITDGQFGWWCKSNDSDEFSRIVNKICSSETVLSAYGKNARNFLEEHYTADKSYKTILRHFN